MNRLNQKNCVSILTWGFSYLVLFLLVCNVIAEDVDLVVNDSALVDNEEEFDWQWSGGEADSASTKKNTKPSGAATKTADAIDASAYNDLVVENLKLRQRVAEKERLARNAEKKASGLAKERSALESRIASLAATINNIEKEKSSLANTSDRSKALAEELTQAEKAKEALSSKMRNMEKELKELRIQQQLVVTGSSTSVTAGSDLFNKMREDNSQLKIELSRLEKEYGSVLKERNKIRNKEDGKVAKANDEIDELEDMLKASKSGSQEQKDLIDKLLVKLPAMEEELALLRKKVGGDEVVIAAREQELESVKEELQLREHRLIKAERIAAMLDQARDEVRIVSDDQKRDMHYNMAVVYAKEGKVNLAEEEYLQALRIDPMDASSHYNLAILYDDELSNKDRALIHYKRYLRLSPSSADQDEVRQWIMKLEMR